MANNCRVNYTLVNYFITDAMAQYRNNHTFPSDIENILAIFNISNKEACVCMLRVCLRAYVRVACRWRRGALFLLHRRDSPSTPTRPLLPAAQCGRRADHVHTCCPGTT